MFFRKSDAAMGRHAMGARTHAFCPALRADGAERVRHPQEASATAARRARGVRDLARGDARYSQGSQGFQNSRTQKFKSRKKVFG
eukprot:COSAG02_NODE_4716_length_5060_cov_2.509978_4_plen_85_part_00